MVDLSPALRPKPVGALADDAAGAELFREAKTVADGHVIWAASVGLHPCDVLGSIRSRQMTGDWMTVRGELARAWIALQTEGCV